MSLCHPSSYLGPCFSADPLSKEVQSAKACKAASKYFGQSTPTLDSLIYLDRLLIQKCTYAASYGASNIYEISLELLSVHRATSARTDNRTIDISQIFDVRYEAAHAHIFSVISPEKSRSLWL